MQDDDEAPAKICMDVYNWGNDNFDSSHPDVPVNNYADTCCAAGMHAGALRLLHTWT